MTSTSPLVSVLKFKHLNAQLTESEFDIFMSRAWRIIGREKILTLLCNSFLNHRISESEATDPSNEESDILTVMTRATTDIIQERYSKPKPPTKLHITDMASSLVGAIASFLDQYEYIYFSMTNRKMYLDCISPNRLQKLDLRFVDDYDTIPWNHFRQINILDFNLKQISQFKAINGHRFGGCNQLQTLVIEGGDSTVADLDMLINDSSPCFSRIDSLSLNSFSNLPPDKFIEILSKFVELIHLKLHNIAAPGRFDAQSLSLICPKIEMFTNLSAGGAYRALTEFALISWKDRINTLALSIPNYDIPEIQRLCLVEMQEHEINSIFNSVQSLREISWVPNCGTTPSITFTTEQIERIIKRYIVDQQSLEYLYISTRGHFEDICNGIYRALFMTKKRQREQFEIALNVDLREIIDAEEFVCGISRIIHAVGMCDIEEWIICVGAQENWHFGEYFDWDSMEPVLNDLLQSLQVEVKLLKGTEEGFVLGNNGKMSKHCMWWHLGFPLNFY